MVAAIVIPILFLVFFFIAKKDKKRHYEKWEALASTEEAGVVRGFAEQIATEKKRYFQQLYVWRTEITIIDGEDKIKVIYEKPENAKEATLQLEKRDFLICYGIWYHDTFLANRVINKH